MRVGHTPDNRLVSLVKAREKAYTIDRRQGSSSRWGESESSEYSTVTDANGNPDPRKLYLYEPTEQTVDTAAGEVMAVTVEGYARPSVDIQEDDRLDYHGHRLEVDAKTPVPETGSPKVYELSLSNVVQ